MQTRMRYVSHRRMCRQRRAIHKDRNPLPAQLRAIIAGRILTMPLSNRSKTRNPSRKTSSIQYHYAWSSGFHCAEHPSPFRQRQSIPDHCPIVHPQLPTSDDAIKTRNSRSGNQIKKKHLLSLIHILHNLALPHLGTPGLSPQRSSSNSRTNMLNGCHSPRWKIGDNHRGIPWMKRNAPNTRTSTYRWAHI